MRKKPVLILESGKAFFSKRRFVQHERKMGTPEDAIQALWNRLKIKSHA